MLQRLLLFFCWWLLANLPVFGQPGLGFRTFLYTTENGLPSNGLKGMQWDEESGFLWIATEAGLSRFNGIDFVNFTRSNTSFISSERMRFMVRNITGQIRAADMDGNVFSIAQNQPKLLFGYINQDANWLNKLVGSAISDSFFKAGQIPTPNRITFPFAQVFPKNEQSAYLINPGGTVALLDLKMDSVEYLKKMETTIAPASCWVTSYTSRKGEITEYTGWMRKQKKLYQPTSFYPERIPQFTGSLEWASRS